MRRAEADRQPARIATEIGQTQRTGLRVARAIAFLAYFSLLAVEIVLAIGFTLRMFGANLVSPLVKEIYRGSALVMRPFRGILEPIELGTVGVAGEAVFDPAVLLAMLVYGIVVLIVQAIIMGLTKPFERTNADALVRRGNAAGGRG